MQANTYNKIYFLILVVDDFMGADIENNYGVFLPRVVKPWSLQGFRISLLTFGC